MSTPSGRRKWCTKRWVWLDSHSRNLVTNACRHSASDSDNVQMTIFMAVPNESNKSQSHKNRNIFSVNMLTTRTHCTVCRCILPKTRISKSHSVTRGKRPESRHSRPWKCHTNYFAFLQLSKLSYFMHTICLHP